MSKTGLRNGLVLILLLVAMVACYALTHDPADISAPDEREQFYDDLIEQMDQSDTSR